MKPKKFVAATTRAALTKVREALGDDAVILSNRATHNGVEVVAIAESEFESLVGAVEADSSEGKIAARPTVAEQVAMQLRTSAAVSQPLQGAPQSESRQRRESEHASPVGFAWESGSQKKPFSFVEFVKGRRPTKSDGQGLIESKSLPPSFSSDSTPNVRTVRAPHERDGVIATPSISARLDGEAMRDDPSRKASPKAANAPPDHGPAPMRHEPSRTVGAAEPTSPSRSGGGESAILDELKSLRTLVEGRGEAPRSATPDRGAHIVPAMLRRELLGVGFQVALIDAALHGLPTAYSVVQARDWVEARLARSLGCGTADEDVVETGGIFALTGPTGVGKTTTAAKLAARCAVRYGAQSVGLITTDTYRIGAPDQLRIYGKILGVPVHTVHDFDWLHRTLDMLQDRRLILIDTIGMGQRDARVQENLDFLDECRVKRLLLLAAPSQPETQEEVVEFYRGRTAVGTILTKIDEAVKLAPAISVLLRFKQRLRYVANGQRVPEDLQIPDASRLIRTALRADAFRPARPQSTVEVRHSAAHAR
ncbi:MAG: flagellar biosynthesis protein FlhF [Burkholderiales bacterium]